MSPRVTLSSDALFARRSRLAAAYDGSVGPSPRARGALDRANFKGGGEPLRGNNGQAQPDPKRDQPAPPGQFVSDEHEADCSRFLREVKELLRHRYEAGLARER
jgi:hypothetical protein